MIHKQLFSKKEKVLAILCAALLMTFVLVGYVFARNEISEAKAEPLSNVQTSTK